MRVTLLLLIFTQAPDFRGDVALVHVDVEIRQGGRPVENLRADDFRVRDDGRPQPIVNFGHTEETLDVILLLDTSTSMRPVIEQVAMIARQALSQLQRGDRVAVMTFDCDAALIADFTEDFGVAEKSIRYQALQGKFTGCSNIQKSLAQSAEPFRWQAERHGRRAVVIVTDDKGGAGYDNAVRPLWDVDAVALGIFVARPGKNVYPGGKDMGVRKIVEQTGGDWIQTTDAGTSLAEMIAGLRSRYSLYYALPGKSGGNRKIKVEVAPQAAREHRGAVVRARAGYVVK